MKKFYNDFYGLILLGCTISLYETTSKKRQTLTIYVIHDGETILDANKIENYYWRADLPTIVFINVNDVKYYPNNSYPNNNISYFRISTVNKTSKKVAFNESTFKEDLWAVRNELL